ncbi:hypothetical protein AMTRI_Chr07g24320 [Amborella trichopoda]
MSNTIQTCPPWLKLLTTHAKAPTTMPPTVVEPPSADPTVAVAIRMGPATAILQFKTSLLSLMYSAVSLSRTTPATSAISVLHPLSVVSSSVLEGVAAALLGHHIVGFIS